MISRILRARWFRAVAVLAAAGVAVGLYWFQPWRLVTDHEVQEALPAVSVPTGPPAGAPDSPPASDGAVPVGNRVLADGAFVSHEYSTRGRAQLVRLADGRHQLLLRDLDTSEGPDLRVWLTDREVVPGRDGWHVFDDGRRVELARLKGNRGNQVYDIPASVALDGLRSVSIWCKRFSVSFGAAPLEA